MYTVPYGKETMRFSLPAGMRARLAVSEPVPPVEDEAAAVARALACPVGQPPLEVLARTARRVCIVFTDSTRVCPDHLMVPPILAGLEAGGVRPRDVTLLCGVGMHRASTAEEKEAKLGAGIAGRYRVIDNEPQNARALVGLGVTPGGVPVSVHKEVAASDLVIATGIVEPHQYAGYSGGCKTLAVGAAGEDLIAHTHGPAFVEHPGTRLGRIEGNPFHEAVVEAARRAGLRYIVNAVLDAGGRILRVASGDPDAVFRDLVRFARSVYEVPVPQRYPIVIAGVGHPKDGNLYQASRAASYLFFAPTCLIRPGGYVLIPAPCGEGAGRGVGEQRFYRAMQQAPDVRSILEDARRNGYPPGQQRAFVLAKVLEQSHVIIVGSRCPEVVSACKMTPAATMEEALHIAGSAVGFSSDVLIVPHAMQTLPVVTTEHEEAGA